MNWVIWIPILMLVISCQIHLLQWLEKRRLENRIKYLTTSFENYYRSHEKERD